MALKLVQPGTPPVGHLDGYDADLNNIRGGEVGTVIGIPVSSSDQAAVDADGADGYVNGTRPVVTIQLFSGAFPLGLVDEGNAPDYGTLVGSVLGANVGQQSFGPGSTGQLLGPPTATASGKYTLWDKPGMYAVTLDAVDTDAVDGLTVTNAGLSVSDPLWATAGGLLTPDVAKAVTPIVARFLNFETDGSLVRTPINLVSAANSPVGQGQPQPGAFTQALINFNPPVS